MSRTTVDEHFANHHADREREFHAIMVRAGLRPEGSRLEDHRGRPVPVEVPTIKPAGRQSEAAE